MNHTPDQAQEWKDLGGESADHPIGRLGFFLGNRFAMRVGALAGLSMAATGVLSITEGPPPTTISWMTGA